MGQIIAWSRLKHPKHLTKEHMFYYTLIPNAMMPPVLENSGGINCFCQRIAGDVCIIPAYTCQRMQNSPLSIIRFGLFMARLQT